MKLKNVTLVFENCDSIMIDGKYIGEFLVDDIHTSIERIACNAIERIDSADTFAIEIHKDANKERFQFDQTHIEDFKQMTFDRLRGYRDITSIQIELIEDYVEEGQVPKEEYYDYYVKWTGESDYTNESQVNYVSDCGNFYIVIAEGKKIEDFFDMEEINDESSMDFHFSMCNVGDKYGNPDRYKSKE